MADIDLKSATPDTSLPSTGFLFGADSQAAAAPSVFTVQSVATTLLGSTTLTGATVTTSSPVIDAAQTWNNAGTTFTGIKLTVTNTASGGSSTLINLLTGTTSRFSVRSDGYTSMTGGLTVSDNISGSPIAISAVGGPNGVVVVSGLSYGFASSATQSFGPPDTILTRRAAANLRLGASDAAAPVAQTLSVQSVVAGTTDTAGANLTITGSQGTGTGAGGSIIFQVAPAGTTGTAQNALATALTINADRSVSYAGGQFNFSSVNTFFGASSASTDRVFAFRKGQYFTIFNDAAFNIAIDDGGNTAATLRCDAAHTLALRNGANAQTFRVYDTFTDASNYRRAAAYWSGADFYLSTEAAGTGVAGIGHLMLKTASGKQIRFYGGAGSSHIWTMESAGHFTAAVDNTYDIGASGATRPRNLFLGSYAEMSEMTAPTAPAANNVRIYAEDNGSGKTRLMARFATGAAVQIAIEP